MQDFSLFDLLLFGRDGMSPPVSSPLVYRPEKCHFFLGLPKWKFHFERLPCSSKLCGISLAKPGALVPPGVPVLVPAPRRPGWGLRTAALPSTHDGFMSGQWQGCLPPWIAGCAASHAGSLERPSTSFSRTRCACNGLCCGPCAIDCDDRDDDESAQEESGLRTWPLPALDCPLHRPQEIQAVTSTAGPVQISPQQWCASAPSIVSIGQLNILDLQPGGTSQPSDAFACSRVSTQLTSICAVLERRGGSFAIFPVVRSGDAARAARGMLFCKGESLTDLVLGNGSPPWLKLILPRLAELGSEHWWRPASLEPPRLALCCCPETGKLSSVKSQISMSTAFRDAPDAPSGPLTGTADAAGQASVQEVSASCSSTGHSRQLE